MIFLINNAVLWRDSSISPWSFNASIYGDTIQEMNETPDNNEKPVAKDERIPGTNETAEQAAQKEADIVTERKNRGVETPHIAQAPVNEPPKLAMSEVKTKIDFRKWVETYDKIFTDPTDKESNTTLAKFFYSPELARYH